jgi:hypothetical protein
MNMGKQTSSVVLGLGWLISLGIVFVLGILSAFAFHLKPGTEGGGSGKATLAERDLMVTVERFSGEAADMGELMSVASNAGFPEQLEQTVRGILRHPERFERKMAFHRLVKGLPNRKRMATLKFLQELPTGKARDEALAIFLEAWASGDGRSAAAFAGSLATLRERNLAVKAVLRGWSRVQPSEAWNWVLQQSGGQRAQPVELGIILRNLAELDRQRAFNLLHELPGGSITSELSVVVIEQLLELEPLVTVIDWISELPEVAAPEASLSVARLWAESDAEAAVRWFRTGFPEVSNGLAELCEIWALTAPDAAADWVWEQGEAVNRSELLRGVADLWVQTAGPIPLAEWINQRSAHSDMDGAISVLAIATARVDPATALVWGQSVSNPDERSVLEIVIGREWQRVDPAGAADNLPLLLESTTARRALLGE